MPCVSCGYDLTGITLGSRCPECGSVVRFGGPDLPGSGKAVTSLVLGILSIVGCMIYGLPAIIMGGLAIIFAQIARTDMRSNKVSPNSRGLATAGLVCGIIGTSLGVLYVGFFAVMIFMVTRP